MEMEIDLLKNPPQPIAPQSDFLLVAQQLYIIH